MTASPSHSASDTPWRRRPSRRDRKARRQRLWAVASVLGFWAAVLALALPTQAHADSNTLASYGATASGWAIQPYVLNDSFLNVPAGDQAAPYVFVSMDNTPGAEAKAAYFFPGTAGNAVFNTQGVAAKVPNGIDARYPSNNPSVSESVGAVDDQNGDAVAAATQSGKTSEGFAQAQAAEASYQFGPTVLSSQPPSPPPLPVVTPPAIPSTSPTPTPTSGSGGGSGGGGGGGGGGGSTPTPSPTPCVGLPIITCQPGGSTGSSQANTQGGQAARPDAYIIASPAAPLPDPVEQTLTTALTTLEAQNPTLKQLLQNAQGPTPNPTLPYASGDVASIALSQATDNGVGVAVATHAANLELFQGLISFATVDSVLQAVAPAAPNTQGSGTIKTTITGASIGGIPVTIDASGVHVVDQNASTQQVQQLSQQLNAALAQAGIQISLTPTVTKTDAGFWQGSGGTLEVTAELNPGSNLPSPASGVPATHVDFTIAQVTASAYALAGTSSGNSGFGCFYCGGFGFGFPGTPGSTGGGSGGKQILSGLSGGQMLAILFIIEGLCAGAVASATRYSKALTNAAKPVVEEETK